MNAKQKAGERAAEFVKDGMTVGLGTGSTAYWTIQRLGEMVKEGLRIKGIPTSLRSEEQARGLGIPLVTFADVEELDIAIDGADEINPALDLTKGGGGALLREKLVAAAARRFIVVADASKKVEALGAFPLPVEVVTFAWETTARRVAAQGCAPTLRRTAGGVPYVTDNGNYILDCNCGKISDPPGLHQALKLLPGVVETGLFINFADLCVIASEDEVEMIERRPAGAKAF